MTGEDGAAAAVSGGLPNGMKSIDLPGSIAAPSPPGSRPRRQGDLQAAPDRHAGPLREYLVVDAFNLVDDAAIEHPCGLDAVTR